MWKPFLSARCLLSIQINDVIFCHVHLQYAECFCDNHKVNRKTQSMCCVIHLIKNAISFKVSCFLDFNDIEVKSQEKPHDSWFPDRFHGQWIMALWSFTTFTQSEAWTDEWVKIKRPLRGKKKKKIWPQMWELGLSACTEKRLLLKCTSGGEKEK